LYWRLLMAPSRSYPLPKHPRSPRFSPLALPSLMRSRRPLCVFQTLRVIAASLAFILFPGPWAEAERVEEVNPFFENDFPFVQTAVDLTPPGGTNSPPRDVVVRGVLLALPAGFCVLFDQELLRVAAVWRNPSNKPPVKLASMSQVSYAEPHRKAGVDLPTPSQQPLLRNSASPGIAAREADLLSDPRPSPPAREYGRGPLPAAFGRFDGVEIREKTAQLRYRTGRTPVSEWFYSAGDSLTRHLQVSEHGEPVFVSLALSENEPWLIEPDNRTARSGSLTISCAESRALLQVCKNALVARIAPSKAVETLAFSYRFQPGSVATTTAAPVEAQRSATPSPVRFWPETLRTSGLLAAAEHRGLACDQIPLPVNNPWKRRIRPADIAFLSADKAAIVTYDGDVWIVSGLQDETLQHVVWRRFASGLNEPLSIARVGNSLQVYTRNGLVRLHDRSGIGEADWYENFSDVWTQSSSSRAFPLDMAVASDGTSFLAQGGIGLGSPFAGGITRVSPDGTEAQIVSTRAREPYLALHPDTGLLTSTDQQGNFIPSSVCYLVTQGANFGFGDPAPGRLTPPLVWIPHHEDNSSASQLWIRGDEMGALSGKLLHLSYGTGTPLLICADLLAPVPQGAVIPLGLKTELPLLHARMHPSNRSVFTCGFQIYDSRAPKNWGLARLRLSGAPLTAPVDAKSCNNGVFLSFASPLDPASVSQESIVAASWNYKRSKEYGSGRFTLAGSPGIDPAPIGQVLLSKDRKTVFIHLPELAPVMQLAINHDFRFQSGEEAKGDVYFTIHQPHPATLAAQGFEEADLSKSIPVVRLPKSEPPTKQRGKEISVSVGCIACHSVDGTTEGKTGPTWKGLFGTDRVFTDGSIESANEFYIRTSILEPEKKIVSGYLPGMASYKGILTDDQIESLILYIRSLSN
jgi:hypothetical protein